MDTLDIPIARMPGQQLWGRVKLTEVNPHLVCVLCHGYFIDATTMAECPHSFCRSCIVLYLETKSYCPICEVQIHKTKPHLNLKPDKTLQDIVYKLVPGLYQAEMKRRREFYLKHPCRDLYLGPEARGLGVERIIYSPEDSISLSLEYYDKREEKRAKRELARKRERLANMSEREREEWASVTPASVAEVVTQQQKSPSSSSSSSGGADGLKRYLQCPAALTMRLLKKFIRLKYGLSQACTVEILYRRESLPDSYSLMDVAYIYTWKRNGPMRFYYRIHVPTTLRTVLPPLKASSEPIRDSTPGSHKVMKSPELLDAVGLRPKLPTDAPLPKLNLDIEKALEEKDLEEKSKLRSFGEKEVQKKEEPAKPEVPNNKELLVKKDTPKKTDVESKESTKKEERLVMTPAEDTAVSLLLALSNGNARSQPENPKQPEKTKQPSVCNSKPQNRDTTASADEANAAAATPPEKPPTGNGGVFKVPQTMTKRFVFNGGKLVPVKPKSHSGSKLSKGKPSFNGKLVNGEFTMNRLNNPLGLEANATFNPKGGKLPPGSPRPPPNAEKTMKTKYMPPPGFFRLTPEITVSRNEYDFEESQKESLQSPPSQKKQTQPQVKTEKATKKSSVVPNGQTGKRKELNRLEQIVQNCLKKETLQKSSGGAKSGKETEVQDDGGGVKRSGTLRAGTTSEANARAPRGDASIRPADHVAANPSKTDQVDTTEDKGKESSILKRKLNIQRPVPSLTAHKPGLANGHEEAKRRLVTPDVSIELMAKPEKCKEQKSTKQEPSELSALTKRFLQDIQRMKKLDPENKRTKSDQVSDSTVNIEKVPAPPSQKVQTPKASPNNNEKSKLVDGSEISSEEDQLFIDIRNKCEALKRKAPEPANIAIERVSEDKSPKTSQTSPSKTDVLTSTNPETSLRPSGTHKKLPRLIEINAPPRPKLPALIPTDTKQKMGLKMTTVRKEVPIGKERPLVRRDSNGALDLTSGMSPPNGTGTSSKTGNKSPFHRPASSEKSPKSSSPSPSPFSGRSSFPVPDSLNKSPPIRIPTLKARSCPSPRPSSLSSSSPSPPAEPKTSSDHFATSAYQQLYRHQMELQSRILASQINNNTWANAKKLEEWMRLVNLPHHPLMYPSLQQLSPDSARK